MGGEGIIEIGKDYKKMLIKTMHTVGWLHDNRCSGIKKKNVTMQR